MLTAKLILERLDKEGRLLERREQKSRSFVKNFIGMLYLPHAYILASAPYSMNDITNTARDTDSQVGLGGVLARSQKSTLAMAGQPGRATGIYLAGNTGSYNIEINELNFKEGNLVGIQVGTGTNAVTPTDVALQTRVAHGRSAGQLEYGGCEFINITFSDPNGEFTIRRYFTNASGGSITVNEVGIYATAGKAIGTNGGNTYIFLIARDKVDPGVAVADTEILRATYVPQITV